MRRQWTPRKPEPEVTEEKPAADAVPDDVVRVEVAYGGFVIAWLPPIARKVPSSNELILVHGAIRRVLSQRYDPETRTARVEIA